MKIGSAGHKICMFYNTECMLHSDRKLKGALFGKIILSHLGYSNHCQ